MIKTIGSGGDFSTLNGANGLFNYVNVTGLTEALQVYIISNITETTSTTLGKANYPITIQPSGNTSYTISGGTTIIALSGHCNMIVDGIDTNRYLTFYNTGTTAVISLLNNSTGNTFKYLNIIGNGTTNGNLYYGTSASGSLGNSNNLIDNCYFNQQATFPTYHFLSSGTAGRGNKNNIIQNCELNNAVNYIYVNTNDGGGYWNILNNHIYQTLTGTTTQILINVIATGATSLIQGNYLGGTSRNCGGGPFVNSGNVAVEGITVNTSNGTIDRNTITNIHITHTTNPNITCIKMLGANNYLVKNNRIGASDSYLKTNGASNLMGINSAGKSNYCLIEDNIIQGFYTNVTANNNVYGMYVQATTLIVQRNLIYNFSNGVSTATPFAFPFYMVSGSYYLLNNMITMDKQGLNAMRCGAITDLLNNAATTGYTYHNSVYLYGETASPTNSSFVFQRSFNGAVSVKNNIFYNTYNSAQRNSVYLVPTTTGFVEIDYNAIYAVDSADLGRWNTSYYTFANWKTTTGKDANSKNVIPSWVGVNDLHLSSEAANSQIITGGTYASFCINDFDIQLRTNPPDIGADQLRQISFYNCLAYSWNF